MKYFLILFFLLSALALPAKEITYVDGIEGIVVGDNSYYSYYSDYTDTRKCYLMYDDKKKQLNFCVERSGDDYIRYEIPDAKRESLYKILATFLSWYDRVQKKKISLNKPLGRLKTTASFGYYSKLHETFKNEGTINFSFFTQNSTDQYLVVEFEKLQSWSDKYVSLEPKTLYFDYYAVLKMKNALNAMALSEFIEKMKKEKEMEQKQKKEIDSEFFEFIND